MNISSKLTTALFISLTHRFRALVKDKPINSSRYWFHLNVNIEIKSRKVQVDEQMKPSQAHDEGEGGGGLS